MLKPARTMSQFDKEVCEALHSVDGYVYTVGGTDSDYVNEYGDKKQVCDTQEYRNWVRDRYAENGNELTEADMQRDMEEGQRILVQSQFYYVISL